ncbi:glycosyltransferase [Actinomyces sp.]|uniref:glycosyltransferase n=1 Tax=Actinomyces sp. TaxID=29317 RepID=UPI0026DAC8B6|nr:glycosyltransferase [Actinomyces sp.]MDO4899357.1 glycosyltransferase [Actinomyces sp.]
MNRRALNRAAAGAVAAVLAVAVLRARPRGGRSQVVLATRLYAPEPAAAALRLRGLARALAAAGAEVRVLTSTPPGMSAPADPGVAVSSAPALRDAGGYIRGYAQYLSFDIPLAVRLLAGSAPDLIVAEPPPTTGAVVRVVAALRGAPYAYYAADVWSDAAASTGAPGWVVGALRGVEGLALRGATTVLAVNDGVAERVRRLGARRVTVVPNGIDTDVFTPDGPSAADAPSAPYFLYAGTASEWQGAGVFIEALRLVHREEPEARLVFLGHGSDWQTLKDLADGDARVVFRDLVPAAQAATWQRGAVASVVSIRPGLGYDFAYPTKIFAALACGTPVVYAGPGPARTDLPDNALGWASDYDAEQVAAAMLAALEASRADDVQRTQEAQRRRDWVMRHRSMQAALRDAAEVLLAEALAG